MFQYSEWMRNKDRLRLRKKRIKCKMKNETGLTGLTGFLENEI